ncbi:MAG TPA: RNA polymerase sigma factor [Tepidisphaeraceae bacterium]
MADDYRLLRHYADERDEAAFAELMRRHVDLVHSAALRRVGNRAMAEDVTQATFMILARKAKSIRRRRHELLSAWLLNAVRYAAANAIKMERRRRKHEHAAAIRRAQEQSAACSPDPTRVIVWQEIAQRLDDAVLRLSGTHRRAVLLRYFENQPIGQMAVEMQLSEGAVKQLLSRAIQKLRQSLSKEGATVAAIDALAFERLLESHVVTSAPATVKAACAAAGIPAGTGIGAGAGTSIAKGAIKMMAWTKTQIAAGVLVAATIGGAGGTLAIKTALAQGQAGASAHHPAPNKLAGPVQLDKGKNNGIISVATSPPVVIATVPQAGATDANAATTTEIKVTFSKPMEPGNFSWVQFGKDTFPETSGKPHFLDDHRTCVLPVKLQPGHPYVIWLNKPPYNSFMDTDGQRAVPYLLVFETKP